MKYDSINVSNLIIDIHNEINLELNNMKLQSILYLVQI